MADIRSSSATRYGGVDLNLYHQRLSELDNPFFNRRPAVRRYVNYRMVDPVLGNEGLSHFDDYLRMQSRTMLYPGEISVSWPLSGPR
jgi:hypothetical protein